MSIIMKLSEVTVKVTSVIENLDASGLVADEPERTETTAVGYLHVYENDTALVTYRESGEGGTVTTEIAVRGKTVTVSRKGAIESCMVFEEGKTHEAPTTDLYADIVVLPLYHNAIVDNILFMISNDTNYKSEFIRKSKDAYLKYWNDKAKGKRQRRMRW